VPFSFVAGHQALSAGKYTIEQDGMFIILRSAERNATMLLATHQDRAPGQKSYVLFRRHGAHYFLAEVWRQGSGQALAPGEMERELTIKRDTSEVARVEARLLP
jgi:hypothetical protein